MKKIITWVLATVIALGTFSGVLIWQMNCKALEKMEPGEMKVCGLENPLGIDTNPVFSWQNTAIGYAREMTAYRVIVSSTAENVEKENGDVWDSGKVESKDNYNVEYAGNALTSRTEYFWRVCVWDENDEAVWSATHKFETGILNQNEWNAAWIKASVSSENAPMFRKEFSIDKQIKKARVYISGLGLFEMKVNGERPDDTVLNPVETQYNITVDYRVFDITEMLTQGQNAVTVELGNGFYNNDPVDGWYEGAPRMPGDLKFIAELIIEYTDGTNKKIFTDNSWKMFTDGPLTYNDMYMGEKYDARLEIEGWDKAGFNDSDWPNAVKATAPAGKLRFQCIEPMRIIKKIDAKITNCGGGTFIVALPVNTTGWARFRFNEPKNTKITMLYGENMRSEKEVSPVRWSNRNMQSYEYICKGGGEEYFEPKFSYAGYQYIQVSGLNGTLTTDDVECYLIANDVEQTSTFETDNQLINTLHEMFARTLLNNFQGKPTDCPTWEKLGWTGDYDCVVKSIHFNYALKNFNAKFMGDMKADFLYAGSVPTFSPRNHTYWSNCSTWNAAYIDGVYEAYRAYGDVALIREHYDQMRAQAQLYVNVLKEADSNGVTDNEYGIVKRAWIWTNTDALNDWQGPNGESTAPEGSGIVGTAAAYRCIAELAEMAEVIGKSTDAVEYQEYMANIYNAFNNAFYNEEKGYYDTGYWNPAYSGSGKRTKYRQTSNLVAVAYGLCPEESLADVVKSIADDVIAKDYHLDTGSFGTKLILPVLSENGYADVAYKVINQVTMPSWGFWVENGATTCWEGYPLNGTRSHNHYFLGTYDQWLFENVAGIADYTNGYATVTIDPEYVGDLTYCRSTLKTVRGKLAIDWKRSDGITELSVVIPVGTTATVYLPAKEAADVLVNGQALAVQKGIVSTTIENGRVKLVIKSGEYNFTAAEEIAKDIDALKADLNAVIDQANAINTADYICGTELISRFEDALAAAKKSVSTSDKLQLITSKSTLEKVIEEIFENKKGNLARGSSVTQSGQMDGNWGGKENLVDGDRKNLSSGSEKQHQGWSSPGWEKEAWVQIDLGGEYNINTVDLYPTGNVETKKYYNCDWFPLSYNVQTSLDGDTWETVDVKQDVPIPVADEDHNAPVQRSMFETVKARYIKVEVTDVRPANYEWWDVGHIGTPTFYAAQLAEIEVYNNVDANLRLMIEEAEKKDSKNYSEQAWNEFSAVLQRLKNKEYTDNTDVEQAVNELAAAIEKLEEHLVGNIALGKNVLASQSAGGSAWDDPQKLTDGDRKNLNGTQHTGWSSSYGDNNAYVQIDLSREYTVNTVDIYPTGLDEEHNKKCDWFPLSYKIQTSLDGNDWKTVDIKQNIPLPIADEHNNAPVQRSIFEAQRARYIRVQVTELRPEAKPWWASEDLTVLEQYAQFAEIEIYNMEHNLSYVSNGDGTHTIKCSHCNYTGISNCFGGKATDVSKAVCDKCNGEYGELARKAKVENIEHGGVYYGDKAFKITDMSLVRSVIIDDILVSSQNEEYTVTADNGAHKIKIIDWEDNIEEYVITVYKIYTVTFVADGKVIKTEQVGYGKDAMLPEIPEKPDYNKTVPIWDKDGKNIIEDTIITAIYTPNVTDADSVESGDSSIFLWAALLLISISFVTVVLKLRKMRQE